MHTNAYFMRQTRPVLGCSMIESERLCVGSTEVSLVRVEFGMILSFSRALKAVSKVMRWKPARLVDEAFGNEEPSKGLEVLDTYSSVGKLTLGCRTYYEFDFTKSRLSKIVGIEWSQTQSDGSRLRSQNIRYPM